MESLASGSVNFICKACPNGCRLQLKRKDAQTVLIHGNGCAKGIAYAYSSARQGMPGNYISARDDHQFKKVFFGLFRLACDKLNFVLVVGKKLFGMIVIVT